MYKLRSIRSSRSPTRNAEVPNIGDIYATGMQVDVFEHAEGEAKKLGNLRAGNTGIVTPEGVVIGKCARKTLLRREGVHWESHPMDRLLMFSAGYASEDIWYERLDAGWEGTILREEEIPIEWLTSNGTKVTGRPDMVLVSPPEGDSEEGKPVCVLEMKNVSSLWTARSVLFEETPKFDHLAQAAHYSWQLGIPAKICYSLYLDMAVGGGWQEKLFPRKGDNYSEYCEYGDDSKKTGRPGSIKKVKPFIRIFDLKWTPAGTLLYRIEGSSSDWILSPITLEGIQAYYEMLSTIDPEKDKQLPPRPLNLKGDGSRENWTQCNYCSLLPICERHEGSPRKWMDAVRATAAVDDNTQQEGE